MPKSAGNSSSFQMILKASCCWRGCRRRDLLGGYGRRGNHAHAFLRLAGCAIEAGVAAAFTQLADWHLKISADAEGARGGPLRRDIVARFPDTEAALMAEQRLAHLSEAEQMLEAKRDRRNIELPEGVESVGLLDSMEFLKPAGD